jgi:cyanophycinase
VALEADQVHITLIGGGWDERAQPAIYESFVREASAVAARHSGVPRVAVVLLDEGDGVEAYGERFVHALRSAGDVEPFAVPIPLGGRLNIDDLADADGLLVGGGLTPEYAKSVVPVREELIRWLLERGAPYAGFSAGAAIAAADAVVGGWRHHGRPICPEDAGEDLGEVTVVAGLGLVPFTVEVHADAWETTPRLRAAIADLGEGRVGYALDEDTALIVHGNRLATVGRGEATRIVGISPYSSW